MVAAMDVLTAFGKACNYNFMGARSPTLREPIWKKTKKKHVNFYSLKALSSEFIF